MKIRPKKGLKVPKLDGTFLKDDGELVKKNSYWVRRLNDGDVELVVEKSLPKTNSKSKKNTEGEI